MFLSSEGLPHVKSMLKTSRLGTFLAADQCSRPEPSKLFSLMILLLKLYINVVVAPLLIGLFVEIMKVGERMLVYVRCLRETKECSWKCIYVIYTRKKVDVQGTTQHQLKLIRLNGDLWLSGYSPHTPEDERSSPQPRDKRFISPFPV